MLYEYKDNSPLYWVAILSLSCRIFLRFIPDTLASSRVLLSCSSTGTALLCFEGVVSLMFMLLWIRTLAKLGYLS